MKWKIKTDLNNYLFRVPSSTTSKLIQNDKMTKNLLLIWNKIQTPLNLKYQPFKCWAIRKLNCLSEPTNKLYYSIYF